MLNRGVRTAAEALRQLREEDPWFSYPDAVEMLSMLDESEVSELVMAMAEPSAKVRAAVARALGAFGSPLARTGVEGALSDSSPDVRRAAVASLGEWDDTGVLAELGRVIREDPDRYTRLAAVQVLAGSRDPAAGAPLADFLAAATPEDGPVLGDAVEALAGFGPAVAMRPLLVLLGHPEAAVREKALAGLSALGDPAAVGPLRAYAVREDDVYLAGVAVKIADSLPD